MSDVSLFEYSPETGGIEYIPSKEESEVLADDSIPADNSASGDPVSDTEISEETQGTDDTLSGASGLLGPLDAVSEQQLAQALLASSPASGSLSSSTIDYFDRLVSGLPEDCVYVAYRNDSDDSYAGTIIYGDDYDLSGGDTIVFGSDAVSVDVSRISQGGYNNYITYDTSDASGSVVTVVDSGTVLYYTNAFEGYPVLGGYERPVEFSQVLVVGLIAVFASVILNKLFNR